MDSLLQLGLDCFRLEPEMRPNLVLNCVIESASLCFVAKDGAGCRIPTYMALADSSGCSPWHPPVSYGDNSLNRLYSVVSAKVSVELKSQVIHPRGGLTPPLFAHPIPNVSFNSS